MDLITLPLNSILLYITLGLVAFAVLIDLYLYLTSFAGAEMPTNILTNTATMNSDIPSTVGKITAWHYDRNLIDGASDSSQFTKLFEEFIELYMSINPGLSPEQAAKNLKELVDTLHSKGKIRTVSDSSNMPDDIGDINVVLINIAERNNYHLSYCLQSAYNDIKDRKGRMINGVFVKEQDLPENQ